jgi:superfamily II DNA or RNA helicase
LWLHTPAVGRVLILGNPTDELAGELDSLGLEARSVTNRLASRSLHGGAYRFSRGPVFDLLLVEDGLEPSAPSSVRVRRSDGHVRHASEFLDDMWDASQPVHAPSGLTVGMLVHPAGSPELVGTVVEVRRRPVGHEIVVEIEGSHHVYFAEDLTPLKSDYRRPVDWLSRPPVDADRIASMISWLKLANPLSDTLYSFASTRTVFKAFQFIPVLKMLRSSTGRLLVADEVGLGKTIEAGLIWTELEQREPVRRALVVVPSALRFKWQAEMRNRFMRPLRILTSQDLAEWVADLDRGEEPDLVGIVTLETLRTKTDLLEKLATLRPHFQLVIFDEAHQLRNRTSASYHVGSLFSDWSDNLIFLSATPLNLGEDDLFNLVNVLDPGGFPDRVVFREQLEPNRILNEVGRLLADPATRNTKKPHHRLKQLSKVPHGSALTARPDYLRLMEVLARPEHIDAAGVAECRRLIAELNTLGQVLTRTRKVDVPVSKAVRQAESVPVAWTPEERRLYDAVFAHYRQRAMELGQPPGFVMQMPLRMACSSLPVMQRRMAAREGWSEPVAPAEDDSWDSDDGLTVADFGDPALEELRDSVLRTHLDVDSKYDALLDRLRSVRASGMTRALIFSFFRGTVEYLVERLTRDGISARPLHGGILAEDRESVIDQFRRGEFDVLVANQVGSEGLDFQFCNVLVNYDLPWNPMQVEQRIGRLDRFGQEAEKIFIFNMHVPGTIESDIVERLYHRIGVFERSIGDLEPILREGLSTVKSVFLDPRLSPEERDREIDRFEVATKNREFQLKALEESSGLLSSLHQLEVEGLTDSGPSDGRYIGHSELRRLLERLARGFDTRLIDDGDVLRLLGDDRLARELSDFAVTDVGTSRRRGALIPRLRSGSSLDLTLDPNHADSTVELVSSRHPLVRFEIERMRKSSGTLPRFGELRLRGVNAASLAQVDLVRVNGVTPSCELWVTAVAVDTGERLPTLETQLMEALAEGRFLPASASHQPIDLGTAVAQLDLAVSDRWWRFREDRVSENDALAEARINSQRSALQRKITGVEDTLQRVYGPSIIRMHEGRIRGLQEQLAALERDLVRLKKLDPSRSTEAFILIRP